MSYAPYSNDHRGTDQGRVLGFFHEVDFGHGFEYAERGNTYPADFFPEYQHVVFVGNGETRLANVKKTVLTLLNGDEVVEKWHIMGHRVYA